MSALFRFALIGFPSAERLVIESALCLPRPGAAGFARVDEPEQADLIVINADDRWSARRLRQQRIDAAVLLVGQDDVGTGWPVVHRPVEPGALRTQATQLLPPQPAARSHSGGAPRVREFEATVPFIPLAQTPPRLVGSGFEETRPFEPAASSVAAPRPAVPSAQPAHEAINPHSVLLWRDAKDDGAPQPPEAAPPPPFAGSEPDPEGLDGEGIRLPSHGRDLARQREKERQQQSLARDSAPPSSSFAEPLEPATAQPGQAVEGLLGAVLLVGEARLADSSLIRELRALGCQVDLVQDTQTALARLAAQPYRFVFLDDRSLGGRTLGVCRALRRRARVLGQVMNLVVMARPAGWLRRLQARWAGCDTWMTLPLERQRLAAYLRGDSGARPRS